MKNDRVRKFLWLDTRSPEEDRYAKQIEKDKKVKVWKNGYDNNDLDKIKL